MVRRGLICYGLNISVEIRGSVGRLRGIVSTPELIGLEGRVLTLRTEYAAIFLSI
jgi:hypothetical protein